MSRSRKRRFRPSGLCDVPGCGQAIRFVKVMRHDPFVTRDTERTIAVNITPARPDSELAAIAAVFVVSGDIAVDVPADQHEAAMQRAGFLYVEHKLVCLDPNWRRARNAKTYAGRPGED